MPNFIWPLFRLDVLDPVRTQTVLILRGTLYALVVDEIVRICLWYESPLVRFLHEVFITLFVRKHDRILFGFEVEVSALHGIRG